jgi:flagellar hook-associated protein 2
MNDATLDSALASDPAAVAALFRSVGTTSGSGLSFVSTTSKTKASSGSTLNVNITQVSTKTTATGAVMSGTTSIPEVLTFKGGPFGTAGVTVSIAANSSLSDIISTINNDSRTKDLIVASNDGGRLKIESSRYGTPGRFTVESTIARGAGGSEIGTTGQTTSIDGLDVAGTINGEAATGSGQFLTGSDSSTTTAGLQIQYTGITTGAVGTVSLTKGIAAIYSERLDGYLDVTNGIFASSTNALQSTSDDFDKSITSLQTRLASQEAMLRQKFARMEQAMQQAQAQGQRFSAMAGR